MFRPVEVPLWLLILIIAFAAVTFASHFLFPSVRWFFRRRMERAVAYWNAHTGRPIEPFKLVRRYDTIQRLTYDPEVMQAVDAHARALGVPRQVAHETARAYAREIVPSFSATAYFSVGTRLARWLSMLLYRVRTGVLDEEGLAAIPREAAVVFVMNHRSNMDYVLVTFLVAQRGATLSYAVGEWARVWPLSWLIRSMGAFFIQRRPRNALYRRVLARYVQIATAEGVTQAVFPEGRLSLDGRVGAARLGLLTALVEAPGERPLWFVPVALNYDRVLEDRFLTEALRSGSRRFPGGLRTVGYVVRRIWGRLRGRFRRYGFATVSFGTPLALDTLRTQVPQTAELPARLGAELMARIRAIVPVLPVPLVARALLAQGPLTRPQLEAALEADVARLRQAGAHVHLPGDSPAQGARLGADHLLLRKVLVEEEGVLRIAPGDEALLAYYAASIAHLAPDEPAEDQGGGAISSAPASSPLPGPGEAPGSEVSGRR